MRPTSAGNITAPGSGRQDNAAMKAPVRRRPGRIDRRAGRPATSVRVLSFCRSRERVSGTARSAVGFRFAAVTMSGGRIANCYGLLHLANRKATKPSSDESGASAITSPSSTTCTTPSCAAADSPNVAGL